MGRYIRKCMRCGAEDDPGYNHEEIKELHDNTYIGVQCCWRCTP